MYFYKVYWRDFLNLVREGLNDTKTIFIFLVIFLGIYYGPVVQDWNGDVAKLNTERISAWQTAVEDTRRYNETLTAYTRPGFERLQISQRQSDSIPARYAQFVINLEQATDATTRETAYLRYLGKPSLNQDELTIGQLRAVYAPNLTLADRLTRLAPNGCSDSTTDRATHDHLLGLQTLHPLPPRPAAIVRHASPRVVHFMEWCAFVLAQIMMLYAFLSNDGVRRNHNKDYGLPLPANVGGWLILLAYAPVVLVVCMGTLHFAITAWCFEKSNWFLIEADAVACLTEVKRRLQDRFRRARKQVQEAAQHGEDVMRYRFMITQAKEQASKIMDETTRKKVLARIKTMEKRLEAVARRRTKVRVVDPASTSTPDLEELEIQITALKEAEEAASGKQKRKGK